MALIHWQMCRRKTSRRATSSLIRLDLVVCDGLEVNLGTVRYGDMLCERCMLASTLSLPYALVYTCVIITTRSLR